MKMALCAVTVVTTVATAANYQSVTGNALVTASTVESYEYSADKLIDGDQQTRWASEFADNQEVVIDLGSTQFIDKITLNWEAAFASKFKISLSNDGENWGADYRGVYERAGLNGAQEFVQDFGAHRYIKLELIERATDYGFSLFEIEVFQDLDLHYQAKTITLKNVYSDYIAKGLPKPECTWSTLGTMVIEGAGRWYTNTNAYICLSYAAPDQAQTTGWVPFALGSALAE
ncbi:MAG: discoidin domain-containing protein [Fibrobacterales bacterium]